LLQLIRQEGLRRERPLLLDTLKAVASSRLQVEDRRVVDSRGVPTAPICLNVEVEQALAKAGESA
jgi:hypothetical protein